MWKGRLCEASASGWLGSRFFWNRASHPEVEAELRKKGHDLKMRKDYSALMGRGQAVLHQLENWYEFCRFRSEGRRFGGAGTDSGTVAALTT